MTTIPAFYRPFIPGQPIRQRATAFVIRRDPMPALLVYYHPNIKAGLYLPGGGIEAGEAPFDAVCRELIEESGLDLKTCQSLRSLPVFQYYKPSTSRNIERHDFVFLAPPGLPELWTHADTAEDENKGEVQTFQWVTPAQIERVHPEFHSRITADSLPELFIKRGA